MTAIVTQLVVNALVTGLCVALFAVGFGVIYSAGRFFNFAHAVSYSAGAYAAYTLVVILHEPFWLAITCSLIFAALTGILMDLLVFAPLRRRGAASLGLFLASLGLMVVLQNIVSVLFGEQTYAISEAAVREGFPLVGARVTPVQLVNAAMSIAATSGLWFLIYRTGYGRMLRAIACDQDLALVTGIRVPTVVCLTFALTSALAGLSGILAAYDTGLSPSMGFNALLIGVAAALIGGMGSVRGVVFACILIALVRNLSVLWLPSQWQDATVFVVLIIFLIARPQGFSGRSLPRESI